MPNRRLGLAGTLGLLALGAPCVAQQDAPPADILRGPAAAETPARRTIVVRDAAGALQPLDTRPEQAALEALGLTGEQRAAADKVLAEHAAAVSRLLYENLALFTKIQSARQSNDRDAAGPLLRELQPLARDLIEPPLGARVCEALPPERREEFRDLMREYVDALGAFEAQNRPGMMEDAKRPARAERRGPEGPFAARRFEMNQLLREMARTLRAVVDERKARTEEILRQVEATPEQEAQIRRIVREAGEASGGKPPSAEQRGETFRRIMDVLTPEQRRRAIERMRPGRGD